ncbi:uncharacterized protein MYCFIDRAFT_80907 [Pseudocercospora fijiensis CIRAD86]|uniref:Uncharacterized protein n=1 Tax=Pseudocercospora fijiensis (strain CIRAD86) TaxID=383855 RepID=M3AMY4_PSEFD|nr:uncharacterized protein MYCFIDRAFT_80907 [Pseudocercospora fijiensis CIRAD86]EME78493.1 hypothetical protein MYCFIDRAFT_80907 [Pseudocercospora fijiensis CIRAD86]
MFHFGYPFDYAVPARRAPSRGPTEQSQVQSRGRAADQTTQARPRMPSRSRTSNSFMHIGYPFDYAVPAPNRRPDTANEDSTTTRLSASARRYKEMPPDPGYVDRSVTQSTRGRSKTRSRPDSTTTMAESYGGGHGRAAMQYHSDDRRRSRSRNRETRYGKEPFLNMFAGEHLVEAKTGDGRSRSRSRLRPRPNLYQDAYPDLLDVARGPQFLFQHKGNTPAADATTSRRHSRSRQLRAARSPSRSVQADLLAASRPDLFERQADLKEVRPAQRKRRNASSHRFDDEMWRASRPDLVDSVEEAERNRRRYENDMFQAGRPDLFRQHGLSRTPGGRNVDYYRPGGGY